jgi:hypothetical protein
MKKFESIYSYLSMPKRYTRINRDRNMESKKSKKSKRTLKTKGGSNRYSSSMNCNPSVIGKKPLDNSCYTTSSLEIIKQAYNKNNPKSQILNNDPRIIHSSLKDKLQKCVKEDCWLKQLPRNIEKKLDSSTFAPDSPDTWETNPDEWLSNYDILAVLSQYNTAYNHFKFIGVTPMDFDTIPPDTGGVCVTDSICNFSLASYISDKYTKIGIIFNMDNHDEGGSHWVSMFIDIPKKIIIYYDSAGNPTPPEIKRFVDRIRKQGNALSSPINMKYIENYPVVHQSTNTECGMYSLFFIVTMLTGKTSRTNHMTITDKINMFTKGKLPDKCVYKFRKIYFNSNISTKKSKNSESKRK